MLHADDLAAACRRTNEFQVPVGRGDHTEQVNVTLPAANITPLEDTTPEV